MHLLPACNEEEVFGVDISKLFWCEGESIIVIAFLGFSAKTFFRLVFHMWCTFIRNLLLLFICGVFQC